MTDVDSDRIERLNDFVRRMNAVDRDLSHSLSRNNPWHGRELTGRVVATFLRGACTARDGRALIPELVGGPA